MGGIRIVRLAGIDVLVHWSWLFIFVLLTWSLSEGLFLEQHPGWSWWAGWAAGAITSLLMFGSVLLHELSHSVMARRQGIDVRSITLFIFGGVSALTQEPQEPRQELIIALVGPLTSFGLAVLFGVAGLVLSGTGAADAVLYLALINAVLGVFNLLPGFPLDGGRVLRSAIWARGRTRLSATRIAAQGGVAVAFALMALGVVVAILGLFLTGIWFIVIGWFLRSQADASYGQAVASDVLQGTRVKDVLRRDYHPVPPEISLATLLSDYVLTFHDRCYPVLANGQLRGLVSLTDLRKLPRNQWEARSVAEIMTPSERLRTVSPEDDLAKAADLMVSGDVHQLPVIEASRFLGFVTRADILQVIQIRGELGETSTSRQASGEYIREAADGEQRDYAGRSR